MHERVCCTCHADGIHSLVSIESGSAFSAAHVHNRSTTTPDIPNPKLTGMYKIDRKKVATSEQSVEGENYINVLIPD